MKTNEIGSTGSFSGVFFFFSFFQFFSLFFFSFIQNCELVVSMTVKDLYFFFRIIFTRQLSQTKRRAPSQKSGTHRENRNSSDSPDLCPTIPDDRRYLRFRGFISRQNLGRSENSKIPDRLGFSRHMKTRL